MTCQVREQCQKVSLPNEWRERFLAKLETEDKENRHSPNLFAQNLRSQISAIKEKLERLTGAYLAEALELAEYQERKNELMAKKKTIEGKLSEKAIIGSNSCETGLLRPTKSKISLNKKILLG